jgi:predicted permease
MPHGRRDARDFSDEIQAHIHLETDRLVGEGMNPDEARAAALRRFGNVSLSEERFYESRRILWLDHLFQDLRYALRTLGRTPSFTAVAVLTFALGIGVNTAVFAGINGFFLRTVRGVVDGGSLVAVAAQEGGGSPVRVSYPDYVDLRDGIRSFDGVAGFRLDFVGMSNSARTERVIVAYTTSNYFDMLGVGPSLGRLIGPGEGEAAGSARVVVLGHRFWQRRFGGDPGIIGRSLRLNAVPYTIVGVAAEDFRGTYSILDFDAYIPIGLEDAYHAQREQRDARTLNTLARLRPGVSLSTAQTEVDVLAGNLEAHYPETNRGVSLRLIPERLARPEPSVFAGTAPLVITLFLALSGAVLLVACLNVVNLLLVRSSTRHRELAIRMALGASRWRIARQLLTESVLLASLGGIAGGLIGAWTARLMSAFRMAGDFPAAFDLGLDWRVYAYAASMTVVVGVLAGVWPVLTVGRRTRPALQTGPRGDTPGVSTSRTMNALVVGQIAMSFVLLVFAGLLIRSLNEAESLDLGYEPRGVLNLTMDLSHVGYDHGRADAFRDQLLDRVRGLPGVAAASLAADVPHGYSWSTTRIHVEGRDARGSSDNRPPLAGYNAVSPGYFETMRIPILQGRDFDETDDRDAPRVAVISEMLAFRLWEGEDALGRRFSVGGPDGPWIQVVGISQDGLYRSLAEGPQNFAFVPLRQQGYQSRTTLQVRTELEPLSLAPSIQREVRALNADLPVYDVMTMQDMLLNGNGGVLLLRVGAMLAAVPGLIGLVLASVGLYAILAYSVSERTRELGIRMALGAQRIAVLGLVIRQAGVLAASGLTVGLGVALVTTRIFGRLLFGLAAADPTTYLIVVITLSVSVMIACYVPARRATGVDPVVALRHD